MMIQKALKRGYKAGAVDFIRKPYSKLEVYQKINLHLNIIQYEHELEMLLSETVMGSIRSLLDILGFMNPKLYARSNRMWRLMSKLVKELKLKEAWVYETAALLSHLDEIIYSTKVQAQMKTFFETCDETVVNSRPQISEIVDAVPRMYSVAAVLDGNLSHNLMDERYEIDFYELSLENKGRILIKLLRRYEALLIDEVKYDKIIRFLKSEFSQYEVVIQKVIYILEQEDELAIRKVSLSELMSGDLLEEDIKTEAGVLLIGKDTQISTNLLRMLRRFSRHEHVEEPIYIRTEIHHH